MSMIDNILCEAARVGRIDLVKKYLNDDDNAGKVHETSAALHCACDNGHRDIAELLLDHGADIDERSSDNSTPLMVACHHGKSSTVKLLLGRGANVNDVDRTGETALHKASKMARPECVEDLLSHGADTTITDKRGRIPLDLAEYFSIICPLMDHKQSSEQVKTSTMSAAEECSFKTQIQECVTSTLEKGLASIVERIDASASKEEEKNQNIGKLTSSNLESLKIESIINQIVQTLTSNLESKIESIIDHRCEGLRSGDMIASQREDRKKKTSMTDLDESSRIESIIDRQCEELRIGQDKTNQSLEKLASQLTTSNAAVTKCLSDLSTIVSMTSSFERRATDDHIDGKRTNKRLKVTNDNNDKDPARIDESI